MLFQILLVKNSSCRFTKKFFKYLSENYSEWGKTAADIQYFKEIFEQGDLLQFGDLDHEIDYFILFRDFSKDIDTEPSHFADYDGEDYYVGHLTFFMDKAICKDIKISLFKDFEHKEEVAKFLKIPPEIMNYRVIGTDSANNDRDRAISGIFNGLGFKNVEVRHFWSVSHPLGKTNIVHTLSKNTRIRTKVEASEEGLVIPANTEGYIYVIVEDEYETYKVNLEGGKGALFKLKLTDLEISGA